MRTTTTLLAAAALTLAAAASARAADGLVAAGPNGTVSFTSDTTPFLTHAGPGVTVAAVDRLPDGRLLALDDQGRLGDLDAATGRFVSRYDREGVLGPVAGQARTLTVSRDGRSALVAVPGRAVSVELATGAVTPVALPAPGAPTAAPPAYALDTLPDGRLVGLDAANDAVVGQRTPGGTLDVLGPAGDVPAGAVSFTLTPDGATGYAVERIPSRRDAQSRLLTVDPATGALQRSQSNFLRPLDAIAATGEVRTRSGGPRVRLQGFDRRQTLRAILRTGFRADLTSDEGGQTVLSARIGSRLVGFGFSTLEVAGEGLRVDAQAGTSAVVRRAIRRAATQGTPVRLRITVNGPRRGQRTVLTRTIRVVR